MNEAMGLASMNAMPCVNRGGILVNMSNDKDLKDNRSWSNYRVMRDFSNQYGMEVNDDGKLDLVKNSDLNNNYISVYNIKSPLNEEIFTNLLKELELPLQERPVRSKNYLYEVFTGHSLYTPDQLDYDPLLEKIEIEKLSKQLSSNINLDVQEKKDAYYSLGNPYRASGNQIEDETSFSPLMASVDLEEYDDYTNYDD